MRFVLCVLFCFYALVVYSDHLRFDREVRIVSVSPEFAELEIEISWANSWRNAYHYDAVYLFGKYRLHSSGEWHHVVFSADGHSSLSDGYVVEKGANGVWAYRGVQGQGRASVRLRLKWALKGNVACVLSPEDFSEKNVRFAFEGIEMIYMPTSPFYAGNNSDGGFDVHTLGGLPAECDLIGASSNYIYTASSNSAYASYPAGRVNNAVHNPAAIRDWSSVVPAWWRVDFRTPKKILYFGVSGEYNQLSRPATTWFLQGSKTGGVNDSEWVTVWEGDSGNWSQSYISYPVQKAIKVTKPDSYQFYRIRVLDSDRRDLWNDVRICNVAMTETDLAQSDGVRLPVEQDVTSSLLAYPSGYRGFYAMKYELTQEQYVMFLNRLPCSGQYTRTIGGLLDGLKEGEYVFGDNRHRPSHRNGIVVRQRRANSGEPFVFACNLNPGNSMGNLDDGHTLACNYLSPGDMLAYADWCGLRPLSELEYEKMCSPVYPIVPIEGGKAWQTGALVPGNDLTDGGKETESLSVGNVNALGLQAGPVRTGSFLRAGRSRPQAGLSYWGFGELSGNLAEIYYNAGVYGRQFDGTVQGNGGLNINGYTDISNQQWPCRADAFGVRGGSYASGEEELNVDNRRYAENYFTRMDERQPTVGFRLGSNAPQRLLESFLTLENGKNTGIQVVYDTVCDARDYLIRGDVPADGNEPCSYIWYESKDAGTEWRILPGEYGRDLVLKNLTANIPPGDVVEYCYRRSVASPLGSGGSGVVALVVGYGISLNRLWDTVQPCVATKGFTVTTRLPAQFEWMSLENGKVFAGQDETPWSSSCRLRMDDLKKSGDERPSGYYGLELKVTLPGGCIERRQLNVVVIPNTCNPFPAKTAPFVYVNRDTFRVVHSWGGGDRQRWRLVNADNGTLSVDNPAGVLRGVSNTFLKDIVVEAVCADFPDRVYRVRLQETYRDITYSGEAEALTLFPGIYTMECRGAQGGMYSSGHAGPYGASAKGTLELREKNTLYIYAGQMGANYPGNQSSPAPFNGGGEGYGGGGDGGSASDIRLEGGEWNNVQSLRSRIMVAAGGGGSDLSSLGGFGGSITGGSALYTQAGNPGYGATQTSSGQRPGIQLQGGFGFGGSGAGIDGGGGGSGWYGGSSGNNGHDGGGGGSSFISGHSLCDAVDAEGVHTHQSLHFSGRRFINPLMSPGVNSGHGRVRITVEKSLPPEGDGQPVNIRDFGTYRAWSDGTFARSVQEYRHPEGKYAYSGDIGNGIYRIDPDGVGTQQPIDVYGDMTTDGGGWTLVVAQYENNPVAWSQGIQANYDPTLDAKRSFALNNSQIPPHTYTAFGKDLNPTFIGYSQMLYTTGDVGLWTVRNLKTNVYFHVHRASAYYFGSHDPESAGGNTSIWNNTLTYDQSGGVFYSWAFSPQHNTVINKGYGMNGNAWNLADDYAWTVWVR